jgi:hypothetical protein
LAAPALRPLGIGEILDVSLKLAWRNLGTLTRIVLFVVTPAQIVIAIVDISAIPNYRPSATFFETSNQIAPRANEVWTRAAAALVAAGIGFLASQFATGACFRSIAESYLGHASGWRASLGFAARRFHSILWVAFLGGILTILAGVFCLIPGIYLLVAFAVALPVLMSEGRRGRGALGRSRALVHGRWWKTAITLFIAFLLVVVLSALVSGLVSALVLTGATDPVELFLISAVAGTAAALATTPFTAAYHTVIYFDLRVRKEGFDLRLLASRIGVELPDGWEPPPRPRPGPGERPPFWPPPPGWQPGTAGTQPTTPPEARPPIWPPPSRPGPQ